MSFEVSITEMRLRHLVMLGALIPGFLPSPAEAQGEFLKDTVRDLIAKSGVYVSMSSRSPLDKDVSMGPSTGVSFGTANPNPRTGKKYPFSISSFSGDLETADTNRAFGRFTSQQIMSGIGYQWVRGRMILSAQLGLGFAFNKVTLDAAAPLAFRAADSVQVKVDNSFVVRPQVKAEYFLHRKLSVRTQLSYTYSDPDVVITAGRRQFASEWRPHHLQANVAMGFFPFRK